MVIGLIYLFIFFLKSKAKKRAIRITADCVYVAIVIAVTFFTFKDANYITLRAYPFLGIVAGFAVCYFGPGKLLFSRKL